MPPRKPNGVSRADVIEAIQASEQRLSGKVDAVLQAVNDDRAKNAGEFACIHEGIGAVRERLDAKGGIVDRIEAQDTEIQDIRNRTNLWGGGNTLLAIAAGAVAWIRGH